MSTGLTSFSTDEDFRPSPADHAAPLEAEAVSSPDVVAEIDAAGKEEGDSWRGEVAARLQRYRTRRKPSGPRYPSLLLPFDPPEYRYRPATPRSEGSSAIEATPKSSLRPIEDTDAGVPEPHLLASERAAEPDLRAIQHELSAKVIEFPRFAAIPEIRTSDLADPVIDRPRIVEALEVLPPPPALGGMLIEPAYNPAIEGEHQLTLPVAPATILRRMCAAGVDLAIVGSGVATFMLIFGRMTSFAPRDLFLLYLGILGGAGTLLWMAFEFLFLIYAGTTPGLLLTHLGLAGFDGQPVGRATRRWRVFASFLSALSAGLGFSWSLLDVKGLCWHDRITKTYLIVTE